MLPLIGIATGLVGAVLARSLQALTLGTGIFGSIVAVTGDAHQAQLAQDIFRADVRHELSLLVREDMRDVYALMCETVATQVTMGSICLGVCFSVLIEGYASGSQAESFIIKFWAMFTAWATLFTLTSLLLAMWFQMSIKNAVRERLLMKHRIFTPNDTVISSLGGRSLAEQVGRLHAKGVNYLAGLASLAFAENEEKAEEGQAVPAPMVPTDTAVGSGASIGPRDHRRDDDEESDEDAPARRRDSAVLEEELEPSVRAEVVPGVDFCCHCSGECQLDGQRVIRARRNLKAWYNDKHRTLKHKVVELPGFLVGGALIRQPWHADGGRVVVRVYDEATLYIAGRVRRPPAPRPSQAVSDRLSTRPSVAEPARSVSRVRTSTASSPVVADVRSSWIQAWDLNRVCAEWEQDEFPTVRPTHRESPWFERVEGFSVFVNSHKTNLPLYKIVLKPPPDDGFTDVTIDFQNTKFESLTVILREGLVLGTEDEYPKKAFLQEIMVQWPLMTFAEGFIQCGMTCLLCAVFFMHLSRILPVRPLPQSAAEVTTILVASCLAFVGVIWRVPMRQANSIFDIQDRKSGLTDSHDSDLQDDVGPPVNAAIATAISCRTLLASRFTGVVSLKLFRKKRRIRDKLVLFRWCVCVFFCASVVFATLPDPEPGPARQATPWAPWPCEWPVLFSPAAAVLQPGAGILWAASGRQLVPFSAGGGSAPLGPPLRLAEAAAGLAVLGGAVATLSSSGSLQVLAGLDAHLAAGGGPADLGLLGSLFAAPALPGANASLAGVGLGGEASSFAGAPDAASWGAPGQRPRYSPGSGVLVVAVAPSDHSASTLVLVEASGLGGASPSLRPMGRLRPRWPATADGRPPAPPHALHLCVTGECVSGGAEPQAWAAHGRGEDASLTAVGLKSAEVADVPLPWASTASRRIVALAGNGTHLLAISDAVPAEGAWSPPAPEAHIARYSDLLGASTEGEL